MSTIDLSGISQHVYAFSPAVNGQTQTPAPAQAATQAQGVDGTDSSGTGVQQTQHHHHGHGGGGQLFQKLQAAVTTALQSAQANGSSDPNQVIQDAIAKVFKDNGITPHAPQDGSGAAPATGTNAAAGADSSSGAASTAQQAFFQTLQGFGVDQQQFHADFLAAVKSAQAGQADPSAAFKSFPPGAAVDEQA